MRTVLAALVALFAATLFADSPNCPVNYGYSGFAPPSQWKYLPDSEACGSGKTQSPVRLTNAKSVLGDGLRFDYHRSSVKLLNSGHDFRVTMPDEVNNLLFLPGDTTAGYRLENFHFHAPNEHVLPGHPFAGEIHLVHNRGGHTAVVTIFISSNPITISQGQLAKLLTFGRNVRPLQENSNPLEYVRVK